VPPTGKDEQLVGWFQQLAAQVEALHAGDATLAGRKMCHPEFGRGTAPPGGQFNVTVDAIARSSPSQSRSRALGSSPSSIT